MNNISESLIENQESCFCNNFFWVNFAENVFSKIEKQIDFKIDDLNYKEIFNNLENYLKIDDVILNNEHYPYLFDVIENAKSHQEKMHQIIFDDMLDLNNIEILKKFHLLKSDFDSNQKVLTEKNIDFEKYLEIKQVIHDGFNKFLEKSKNELCENFDLKNLDFVDIHQTGAEALKLFEKFNQDSPNYNEKILDFTSRIENYLLLNNQSRMNKVDIGKIFTLIFSGESCKNNLLCDFDQKENFNLNLCDDENYSHPKFSLMRFSNSPKSIFSTGCHAALVYSPEISKKLFLMLLDHTLSNQGAKLEILPNSGPICVEKRFEILFEFLAEKQFIQKDDFENFIHETKYNELYDQFDKFFNKYKAYTSEEIREGFYKNHFVNKYSQDFHFFNEQKKVYSDKNAFCIMPKNFSDLKNLLNLENCIESQGILINEISAKADKEIGKTWLRSEDELSSLKKKNLFEVS